MSVEIPPIIGASRAMKRANELVERFGPTNLPIILVGATGTGKELFARHIHRASRRNGSLVDVNCGALPQEIAESLLFGHRRGAFTGAIESVQGHLVRADRGTLFLDEVLHLSLPAQVKLLRALDTGEVEPLGAGHKHRVDFRVVSAAQEDTRERLGDGLFRQDLFQRLAGVVIELPILADRPEDIVPLATYFASTHGQRLEVDTAKVLERYMWPGNVRELRLTLERAGRLVENGTIPAAAIRDAIALGELYDRRQSDRGRKGWERQRRKVPCSWDRFLAVCGEQSGDPARIASDLGIQRSTLYEWLHRAGLSLNAFRASACPSDVHRTSDGCTDQDRTIHS